MFFILLFTGIFLFPTMFTIITGILFYPQLFKTSLTWLMGRIHMKLQSAVSTNGQMGVMYVQMTRGPDPKFQLLGQLQRLGMLTFIKNTLILVKF
jgi:hypothetical protein